MKKAIFALVLLAASAPLMAAEAGKAWPRWEYQVGGGSAAAWEPEVLRDLDLGVNASGSVTYYIHPNYGVVVGGGFATMQKVEDFLGFDLTTTYEAADVFAGFKMKYRDSTGRPYFFVGLGQYTDTVTLEVEDLGLSASESGLGLTAGAGLDFMVSDNFGVYLEFRYLAGFFEDALGEPIQRGYFPISLGISFR